VLIFKLNCGDRVDWWGGGGVEMWLILVSTALVTFLSFLPFIPSPHSTTKNTTNTTTTIATTHRMRAWLTALNFSSPKKLHCWQGSTIQTWCDIIAGLN
jgi:hypothetical protein